MNYRSFLEEQISLQEKEVKTVGKIMYIVIGFFLLYSFYAIISIYINRSAGKESGYDIIKIGGGLLTGILPFIPRAEMIKRREKISGLKAIKVQYQEIDQLPEIEKEFVITRLRELMIQTLNKI
jgi:hypothetical protein